MAFEKVVYEDNVTVIRAAQLNAIQDEIIRVAEEVDDGGLVGPQGPKGDTGDTGPQGPKGDTPVKGADYWTAADKAEIVSDVLAALPDGTEVSY